MCDAQSPRGRGERPSLVGRGFADRRLPGRAYRQLLASPRTIAAARRRV
jgi:hypothetical protein